MTDHTLDVTVEIGGEELPAVSFKIMPGGSKDAATVAAEREAERKRINALADMAAEAEREEQHAAEISGENMSDFEVALRRDAVSNAKKLKDAGNGLLKSDQQAAAGRYSEGLQVTHITHAHTHTRCALYSLLPTKPHAAPLLSNPNADVAPGPPGRREPAG